MIAEVSSCHSYQNSSPPPPHSHLLSFGVRPVALEVSVSQLVYITGLISYPLSPIDTPSTPRSKILTSVSQTNRPLPPPKPAPGTNSTAPHLKMSSSVSKVKESL